LKILYFECNMGAAGDMLMAALLELHENPEGFLQELRHIGIADVTVSAEKSVKCGITGTHIKVSVGGKEEVSHDIHSSGQSHEDQSHSHSHSHPESGNYEEIKHLISNLKITEFVKQNALDIYKLIAEAESLAHGVPVAQVHFHEVGQLDALTDIIGVCMLIEHLSPDKIISSPINVGSGHVKCSHGILPVPAPATATILKGTPFYSDQIVKGELCTPTGAAILKHFSSEFTNMPCIIVSDIGYGMGTKDFVKANTVRAFIGQSAVQKSHEDVIELACNLDDMTAEAIAYAQQVLFEAGALDVCTSSIGMKKGRTGTKFTCMCKPVDKEKLLSLIFKHTTTLGVREYASKRHLLQREHISNQTKYGTVRIKKSHGYGVEKIKPEYDDITRIATENGLSIKEVLDELSVPQDSR